MALQDAQATGNGAIHQQMMTTVANERWGIPAGVQFKFTFVYLSRCAAWEGKLPAALQKIITPTSGQKTKSGPFKNFPHYDDTAQLQLTPEQVNLLSDMTGWAVMQNKELFINALS